MTEQTREPASAPSAEPDVQPPAVQTGEAGGIPKGVKTASEWSWRLLLIATAVMVLVLALREVSSLIVPLAIATLLAAMLMPINRWLRRAMPKGAAAGLTVVGLIAVVSSALTLVGTQFSNGFSDLTKQVAVGLEQVRDWIRTSFNITDSQFNEYFDTIKDKVSDSGNIGSMAANVGGTATHFVAGIFIALFALFFFLYEGPRIWRWLVNLFPRTARPKIMSSGVIAWSQLSGFVRATIIVALIDAIGIMAGAAILKVPFALAIGVLVFLGAFIPIVGALLTGAVAVLLALVALGPVKALIMLAIVIGVQQIESHFLQPLLLGRAVSVHPLAVILAIAAGSLIAGIIGALTAVPLAAVANGVGKHLLSGDTPEDIEADQRAAAKRGELADAEPDAADAPPAQS